jgi:hypothetical protein
MTTIKLNSSQSSRDRYYLIHDGKGMGGYGKDKDHYLNNWVVVNGVDRGNGYQGYMSIDCALKEGYVPEEAKAIIRQTLKI